MLIASIDGNSGLFGCNMLDILYTGDVHDGYYQGWRDNITAKAGYILTLINTGITLQSAYLTIETGSVYAWTVVQEEFNDDLVTAGQAVLDYDQRALDEWYENAKVNCDRIATLNNDANLDNQQMT